jgi:hypothetical protein
MVMFHYTGLVPADTTHVDPFHEQLTICDGEIIQWLLYQPEECADLLKFWVVYHGTQIFPFNPDNKGYGFFIPTVIDESIMIHDSPFRLDMYAVNNDDSYEHEFNVSIIIKPSEYIPVGSGETPDWAKKIRAFFGED